MFAILQRIPKTFYKAIRYVLIGVRKEETLTIGEGPFEISMIVIFNFYILRAADFLHIFYIYCKIGVYK